MTRELPEMVLKPIGFVRNAVKEPGRREWAEIVSEIVIDSHLTEALDGLEGFSHLIVLCWMHRVTDAEMPLKVHPGRRPEAPLVGLFASRSPNRPNRLAKATVRLLELRDNILKVQGLDAIDGTPVIDIKPFIPGYDSVAEARVPQWITHR
ncbi:MAG: hypothetical protein HW402_266 [Dehalococcoidales bacterium]|nr:hypothetical protein [Dehalococcoidales bacterium]